MSTSEALDSNVSAGNVSNGTGTVRTLQGVVTSVGADKTITVLVERKVKHKVYGKYVKKSTKLLAHDEDNACELGQVVTIRESRPISKRKSWVVCL